MTNKQVREELLDLFEGITNDIEDGTYLKAMNLLQRMTVEETEEYVPNHIYTYAVGATSVIPQTWTDAVARREAIYNHNTDIDVIAEYLKTRTHTLVFPVLTPEEVQFIKNKCDRYRTGGSYHHEYYAQGYWYSMYMNRETYIFNSQTRKFVNRKHALGKYIEKKCLLEQFPDIFVLGNYGRVVHRDYAAAVQSMLDSF